MTSRRIGADHRGYTLVEVLIVVTIIGMAGAIVVPQLLAGSSMDAQAAARMLIADILYAQNQAVAQQAPRRVVFDADQNQYRITDNQGNVMPASWRSGGSANYIIDLDNDSRFQGVRLENVEFSGGNVLEFDDLGTPAQGGSVDVVDGPNHYRISVAAFTGRVTIAVVPGG